MDIVTISPILVSTLVAYLQVQLNIVAKKTNLPTLLILLMTTILVSLAVTAWQTWAPAPLQEGVVSFVQRTFLTQWAIYELWAKHTK